MINLEKQRKPSRQESGGGERVRVGSTGGGSAGVAGVGDERSDGPPPPEASSAQDSSSGGESRGRSKRARVDFDSPLAPSPKGEEIGGDQQAAGARVEASELDDAVKTKLATCKIERPEAEIEGVGLDFTHAFSLRKLLASVRRSSVPFV